MAWLLQTALGASVLEVCLRVSTGRAAQGLTESWTDLPTLLGSQGPLHSPGSKNQTLCLLDVRIGLATKGLSFAFPYELHEAPSY